ncbi:MAG: CDP-alcohol phosphatidyltransferase family protein [Myxococcota bacterium]
MSSAPPVHPNVITAARIPLAPVAVAFMVLDTPTGIIVATVLALLLELTDILDGQIARRYGVVSAFGKLFDPFSDAVTRYTLFLGMYAIGVADLWMLIAIFFRDSSVSFFRSVAAIRQVVVAARFSGKLKAVVQGVGTQLIFISLLILKLAPDWGLPPQTPNAIMWIITLVTLGSLVDYFVGNLPILRAAWNDESVTHES